MEPTHIYTGKTNIYGLAHNTECVIVGKRAGGKIIKTQSGRRYTVNAKDLQKKS